MKYLDSVGLTYLWGKITSIFATKDELADKADADDIPQYVICTLSDYNGMATHDTDTYYIIIEDSNA